MATLVRGRAYGYPIARVAVSDSDRPTHFQQSINRAIPSGDPLAITYPYADGSACRTCLYCGRLKTASDSALPGDTVTTPQRKALEPGSQIQWILAGS